MPRPGRSGRGADASARSTDSGDAQVGRGSDRGTGAGLVPRPVQLVRFPGLPAAAAPAGMMDERHPAGPLAQVGLAEDASTGRAQPDGGRGVCCRPRASQGE